MYTRRVLCMLLLTWLSTTTVALAKKASPPPTCMGLPAQVVQFDEQHFDNGRAEVLVGKPGNNWVIIDALDIYCGTSGEDIVEVVPHAGVAGDSMAVVWGNAGDDLIFCAAPCEAHGGPGNDILSKEAPVPVIFWASLGNDTIMVFAEGQEVSSYRCGAGTDSVSFDIGVDAAAGDQFIRCEIVDQP